MPNLITKEDLSTRLVNYRKKHGLTQAQLGVKLSLQRNTIVRWENMRVSISPAMYRILKSAGVL